MNLTRRERQERGALTPFREWNRLRSEINRLFEEPFGSWSPSTSFFEGWAPPADILEDKDKYVVKVELPGMKKEDIELSLDGNTLTISGERKQEEERKEGETFRSERYYGRFQRSIALPTTVQADKIDANYKDGVLTINLPKSEQSKAKQIPIKA